MTISQDQVRSALAQFRDPHADTDLNTMGAIKAIGVADRRIVVDILLPYPAAQIHARLASQIQSHLIQALQAESATVSVASRVHSHKVQGGLSPVPNVKNIIAVASGKGGVGKSTTAVNLALALAREGARVGVLDADIYGPSVPRMLGMSGKPDHEQNRIKPKINHGIQTMSIGYLIEEDTPMIWRGPMVTQALQQLLGETDWDDLDYLIIDLPPGTGDIQLTLCQRVPVSGAVIVTTPQDIALLDARKALKMFEKVEVPVLGVIENMSTHLCSKCGHEEHIFGSGGGASMAAQYSVPMLGSLPLDIRIREQADSGNPTVAHDPDGKIAAAYGEIARNTAARLAQQARNKKIAFPEIVISNT